MVVKIAPKGRKSSSTIQASWLQKGNFVKVDQGCLVNFSIGKKYQDEVWRDVVVHMHAFHLLLG